MRTSRCLLFLLLVCSVASEATAEESTLSSNVAVLQFWLKPGVVFPLVGENASFFGTGPAITLAGAYTPRKYQRLSFAGEISSSFHSYGNVENKNTFTVFTGGAGLRISSSARSWISFHGTISGGYAASVLSIHGDSTILGTSHASAAMGADVQFTTWFGAGVEGGYRQFFGEHGYGAPWATLGAVVSFSGSNQPGRRPTQVPPRPDVIQGEAVEGKLIELKDLAFSQVFPILYSYYDNYPLGTATVRNGLEESVSDVTVSLFVNQYMDAPKKCATLAELAPGASKQFDLTALFTERMLEITEGTTVAAELILEYSLGKQRYKDSHVKSMKMEYRNAMTWDDDRKAAAFVTAHDPQVLTFSNNVVGMTQGAEYQINKNLSTGIAFHEALRKYGMTYVIDPNSPYEELSANLLRVDTLKFPRESLAYKAGDCDDLSILYSALFESVGIETAFVTIPGHIYLAFSTGMDPATARKQFQRPDDLIFRDEKAWVPLEVTALDASFIDAWQLGAKEWREHTSREQAGFFPIHEAWRVYRPVGLPGAPPASLSIPGKEEILAAHTAQVTKYINQEIYQTVATIQGQIAESGGAVRWVNKLGVLYARYGLYDQASLEFQKALKREEYVPALMNLGNIQFVRRNMWAAKEFYDRALAHSPDEARVLLSVARVNHELENYGTARELYGRLKSVDAELAERFAYLDFRGEEAARASELSGLRRYLSWEEDQE